MLTRYPLLSFLLEYEYIGTSHSSETTGKMCYRYNGEECSQDTKVPEDFVPRHQTFIVVGLEVFLTDAKPRYLGRVSVSLTYLNAEVWPLHRNLYNRRPCTRPTLW